MRYQRDAAGQLRRPGHAAGGPRRRRRRRRPAHRPRGFELFFNDPRAGWDAASETPRRGPLEEFPDVNFADPRVKLADLTGDGFRTSCWSSTGRSSYWPYLGHGRWGRRVTMPAARRCRTVSGARSTRAAAVRRPRRRRRSTTSSTSSDDQVTLWINQSGNGWSEPVTIDGHPAGRRLDAVRLVDMLGTGMAGRAVDHATRTAGGVRQLPVPRPDRRALKPYLLTEMDNHMRRGHPRAVRSVHPVLPGGPARSRRPAGRPRCPSRSRWSSGSR